MRNPSRLALIPLVLAGCAHEDLPEPDTAVLEQQLACGDWMCGSNSPEIENFGIADLHLAGLPNANGFRFVKFAKGGKAYQLSVQGGELIAVSVTDLEHLTGTQVRDGLFLIVRDDSPIEYEIKIVSVSRAAYWAVPTDGVTRYTYTYELAWKISNDPLEKLWKNICSDPGAEDPLTMSPFHAVIFEGDRIDPAAKVVTSVDTQWFNIGCAGHALAKLHLTGHSQGAQAAHRFQTTLPQRTTMLKMFSADYCGRGVPFTVGGVDLTWRDANRWMKFDPFYAPVEARWTARGVACLNEPRLIANPTADGTDRFGTPEQLKIRIKHACGGALPPPCGVSSTVYHLVSGNP